MVTKEAPISLISIEAQAEQLLSQVTSPQNPPQESYSVPESDLELIALFANQRLQSVFGRKDYVYGLWGGTWPSQKKDPDFGRVGAVRLLLDRREKFDPHTNYLVTTLTVNWQDQKQADWSLEVVQEERDYLPQLKSVTITNSKGSARFVPQAVELFGSIQS